MAPPNGSTHAAVGEFAKLSLADRRAILRHLSNGEREALVRLLEAGQVPAPPERTRRALGGASPYSSRLTHHLQRLLDTRAKARITPDTHKALKALLAAREDRSSSPDHA